MRAAVERGGETLYVCISHCLTLHVNPLTMARRPFLPPSIEQEKKRKGLINLSPLQFDIVISIPWSRHFFFVLFGFDSFLSGSPVEGRVRDLFHCSAKVCNDRINIVVLSCYILQVTDELTERWEAYAN